MSVTKATGSTTAFILVLIVVIVWGATGPVFHYSETWQLVINTGTTIVPFLMVFLIQKAQNKDSLAIRLKLNELVAAHEFASSTLANVENMSEEEMTPSKNIMVSGEHYQKGRELQQSHSIDEAKEMTEIKKDREEDFLENLYNKKSQGQKDENKIF